MLLGLLLVISPTAWASTANGDVEITDPEGDAGPAEVGLGPATSDVDILSVDFVTEDNQTTVTMELASFDLQPHETFYGTAYELNGTSFVWLGYGKVLFPFPPFEQEGFYGCNITGEGEDCFELDGRLSSEVAGFDVQIPRSWAPANAILKDPMAATFHDPFLPYPASSVWWETAWPHNTEDMAGPGESHTVPNETEASALDANSQTQASVSEETGVDVAALGIPALAGLGLLGLAGVALGRR